MVRYVYAVKAEKKDNQKLKHHLFLGFTITSLLDYRLQKTTLFFNNSGLGLLGVLSTIQW